MVKRRRGPPKRGPPTKKEFSHKHWVRSKRTGQFIKRRHRHRIGKKEFPHEGWP